MKNLFVGLVAALAMSAAMAENTGWKIQRVPERTNSPAVGYMYETYAIGTQNGPGAKKNVTALRLICSVSINKPLIAIYWNTMVGDKPQSVEIRANRKTISPRILWEQDGPLLMRSVAESTELIQLLKTSKDINFMWVDTNAVRRTTIFDLKDFNSHLSEFNTYCDTKS